MKESLKYFEEIERYESGEMSSTERDIFEQRLKSDPDLAEEYRYFKNLTRDLKSYYKTSFKKKLSEYEDKNFTSKKEKTKTFRFINFSSAAIAATITIALISVFVLLNKKPKEELYNAYFIEDSGIPVTMGTTEGNIAISEAMNFYRSGEFDEALKKWESLSAADLGNDTLQFYKGIFLLKLEKAETSLKSFNEVAALNTSALQEKAQYYRAMALWKAGKTNEAKVALLEIKKIPDHEFYEIAEEILEKAPF